MPQPLVLSGDAVAALAHDQRRLVVSAETHQCHWDGKRPDYGTAIEVLDGWARVRGEDEGG